MTKNTRKLLVESSEFVSKIKLSKGLKESVKLSAGKAGTLIVRNVPTTILNRKNLNGRIYSTQLLETAIQEAQDAIASRQLLCAGNEHPDSSYVPPTEASHVVINAYIKKGINIVVEGKKEKHDVLFMDLMILNTENGKNARALFEAECSVGTSIRGLGDLNGDVVENYTLLGVDLVGQPSSSTYTRMPVSESVKVELADEKALSEGFTVSTSSTNTVRDLETAAELQNRINAVNYGTVVKTSTKVDEELNPKTGATTSITTLETETQDDVASLDQALGMAKRAMMNGVSHIDSITIDNIDEEEKKEAVEEEYVPMEEGWATGAALGALAGAAVGHPFTGAAAGAGLQKLWDTHRDSASEDIRKIASNTTSAAKAIKDKAVNTYNNMQANKAAEKANEIKIVTYVPKNSTSKYKFWDRSGRVITNPTEKDVWKVIEGLRADWANNNTPEWRRAFSALENTNIPKKMLSFVDPKHGGDKLYKNMIAAHESIGEEMTDIGTEKKEGLVGTILGGVAGDLVGHPIIGAAAGGLAQDTLLDDSAKDSLSFLDQDPTSGTKIEYDPLSETYNETALIDYTDSTIKDTELERTMNFNKSLPEWLSIFKLNGSQVDMNRQDSDYLDSEAKSLDVSANDLNTSVNTCKKAYEIAVKLRLSREPYKSNWDKSFYSLIDADTPWYIVGIALPWSLDYYEEAKDAADYDREFARNYYHGVNGLANANTTFNTLRKYYEALKDLKAAQSGSSSQQESIKEAKEANPNEGRRFVLKCPAGFVAMDGNALVFKANPKEAIHFIVGKEESGLVHLSGVEKILDTMGVYDVEKYYRKDKKDNKKDTQKAEKKEGLTPDVNVNVQTGDIASNNNVSGNKLGIKEDSDTQFVATVKIGGDNTEQVTDTIPVSATEMSAVNAEVSNLYDMKLKSASKEGKTVDITVFDNINKNKYHYNPKTKVIDFIEESVNESAGEIKQDKNKLTVDVTDGTSVEKEFDSPVAASIAKSGLEQGKLDGSIMLSEDGEYNDISVHIENTGNDIYDAYFFSQDDDMIGLGMVGDDISDLGLYEHMEYNMTDTRKPYIKLSGLEKQELSNTLNELKNLHNNTYTIEDGDMQEKLFAEPVPGPSDDFVEKPLNDAAEDITIILSDIDWDIDSVANLLLDKNKDVSWIEKINALPSELKITITADELNSAEDIETLKEILLKSANETSNVIINNATIKNVE